jgi:hypothetical protein
LAPIHSSESLERRDSIKILVISVDLGRAQDRAPIQLTCRGVAVLSFFYSGGTPVGGASPLGDIKTPPCARPRIVAVIISMHWCKM